MSSRFELAIVVATKLFMVLCRPLHCVDGVAFKEGLLSGAAIRSDIQPESLKWSRHHFLYKLAHFLPCYLSYLEFEGVVNSRGESWPAVSRRSESRSLKYFTKSAPAASAFRHE
jgi:hypothetical protein